MRGAECSRHTRFRIRDEDGAKTDPICGQTRFPSARLRPLPAQLQSEPSYFLPIEREGGRERERSVFFGRNLYRRLSIIIRGARSFFSSSLLPPRGKEGKLHERNLPRYRKPFRCRADASNLCRVNDRLVKIEKSLAGCLSRASSRFLADPSSCPFTAIFRFRP